MGRKHAIPLISGSSQLLKLTFLDGRWIKRGYWALMDWYWRWKRSSGKESCPDVTMSTTNYTWTGPVLKPAWGLTRLSCVGLKYLNPLNPELNPICYLLALLGAHHFLHVGRIRVKLLTFRLLMWYIYGAPILDVSISHTTTQRSR